MLKRSMSILSVLQVIVEIMLRIFCELLICVESIQGCCMILFQVIKILGVLHGYIIRCWLSFVLFNGSLSNYVLHLLK